MCKECGLDDSLCECNESLLKILWDIIYIPLIVLLLSSIVLGIMFLKMR
jgi:hypothetical protein